MNQLHKSLEFKLPLEEENCINFIDLKIIRNVNQVNINVFQKPTPADTTIHFRYITTITRIQKQKNKYCKTNCSE